MLEFYFIWIESLDICLVCILVLFYYIYVEIKYTCLKFYFCMFINLNMYVFLVFFFYNLFYAVYYYNKLNIFTHYSSIFINFELHWSLLFISRVHCNFLFFNFHCCTFQDFAWVINTLWREQRTFPRDSTQFKHHGKINKWSLILEIYLISKPYSTADTG